MFVQKIIFCIRSIVLLNFSLYVNFAYTMQKDPKTYNCSWHLLPKIQSVLVREIYRQWSKEILRSAKSTLGNNMLINILGCHFRYLSTNEQKYILYKIQNILAYCLGKTLQVETLLTIFNRWNTENNRTLLKKRMFSFHGSVIVPIRMYGKSVIAANGGHFLGWGLSTYACTECLHLMSIDLKKFSNLLYGVSWKNLKILTLELDAGELLDKVFPYMPVLEVLCIKIKSNNIEINSQDFKKLPKLHTLYIFGYPGGNLSCSVEMSAPLNTLKRLSIRDIRINSVKKLPCIFPQVEHCTFSSNLLRSLKGIENWYDIRSINISNNLISDIRGIFNTMQEIEKINFYKNTINMYDIHELCSLKKLKKIDIRNNDLVNEQKEELRQFGAINNVAIIF